VPNQTERLTIKHIETDFEITDLANGTWDASERVRVTDYWSGELATDGRHFSTRILWSVTALYARFDANQAEELVVSDSPDTTRKTLGLWDRDVCEIFVAPDRTEPRRYFEFEITPNGEWLDLAIDTRGEERRTDWNYNSGMESFASIGEGCVTMAMKIPWTAFGRAPSGGDVWLGNIFRCVGSGPDRGYLAYNPTETPEPNFHVPAKFVEFRFWK